MFWFRGREGLRVGEPLLRFLKTSLQILLLTLLLFFLVEGASSTLLFISRLHEEIAKVPRERIHTHYDSLLGWVGIPNLDLPDVYGPGKWMKTDSRGFRDDGDVGERVAPGKLRVICSGDSFTLGYGVDNDHTWCGLLSEMDPRLETVNMGQGGYGLDQAYLWYARDGAKLDQDVLIFAFITEDFRRMQRREFQGFGKPVLKLSDGVLVTENVPVPRQNYLLQWLSQNGSLFDSLKTVELSRKILGTSGSRKEPDMPNNSETWKVVLQIFKELERMSASKGSTLVLVSLPDAADSWVDKSDHWRGTLSREATAEGVAYFDLVDAIRQLPEERVRSLFNQDQHYNEAGNQWVAETILQKLLTLQPVTHRLAERAVPSSPRARPGKLPSTSVPSRTTRTDSDIQPKPVG